MKINPENFFVNKIYFLQILNYLNSLPDPKNRMKKRGSMHDGFICAAALTKSIVGLHQHESIYEIMLFHSNN